MKKSILLLSVVAILLHSGPVAAQEITVSTGATFIDKIFNPVKAQLAVAGLSVKVVYGDPTEALKNLESGSVEVAGASLSLDDWIKAAAAGGYSANNRSVLTPHVVIEEETIAIVHTSNSISSLSKEQLQGVFSGKLQNWNELGGDDMPIMVVWPRVASGALTTFSKLIMDKKEIKTDILDVATINDTSDAVAVNTEAISITNQERLIPGTKKISTPPLKRPLTLLTKGAPTPKVQKLLNFLQTAEARKAFK